MSLTALMFSLAKSRCGAALPAIIQRGRLYDDVEGWPRGILGATTERA